GHVARAGIHHEGSALAPFQRYCRSHKAFTSLHTDLRFAFARYSSAVSFASKLSNPCANRSKIGNTGGVENKLLQREDRVARFSLALVDIRKIDWQIAKMGLEEQCLTVIIGGMIPVVLLFVHKPSPSAKVCVVRVGCDELRCFARRLVPFTQL